jgi:hypothetical protein
MTWLKEHGVAQDYWQYMDLPDRVLSHCRLLMEADSTRTKLRAHHNG